MNAVLGQLSIAIGGVLFVVVLVITLVSGVPIMVAVFRASIVMCLSGVVVAVFFRFLSSILRGFVIEQVKQYNRSKAEGAAAARKRNRLSPGAEDNAKNR